MMVPVIDQLGRPLRDLRVSVTDRCNLRCTYCMPREVFGPGFAFVPREDLLSFDEVTRIVTSFVRHGVTKVRLTGGEPLLRNDLPVLVAMLARIEGLEDLALTTNATRLSQHAVALREAGLHRITVSLDALDDPTFRAMSDTAVPASVVLDGLAAAVAAGFPPPKINAVIRRGVNEHSVLDLADYGRATGSTVRFIEFMDVGHTNGWDLKDVVPADEILETIAGRWDVEPLPGRGTAPAEQFRYLDGAGEIGIVASVSRPFCRTCVRARLSALGELYTCLFATRGHDLRALVRSGCSDTDLDAAIETLWAGRDDRYSEVRHEAGQVDPDPERVEMSYIGG